MFKDNFLMYLIVLGVFSIVALIIISINPELFNINNRNILVEIKTSGEAEVIIKVKK